MNNPVHTRLVKLHIGNIELTGDLSVPLHAHAIVHFVHGSGSSRLSPRNQTVARYLNSQGFATLLFDLLTPEEDTVYSNRFNIELLSQRLTDVTQWVRGSKEFENFTIGYFGASTGAAAALLAARYIKYISAVVSRGGRPDLVLQDLPFVKAPTLLIVGGDDVDVLSLNQKAFDQLNSHKQLEIVTGATHLFEEPGAMEKVSVLAGNWFQLYLQPLELQQNI